jgi:hypothetical protein
VTGTFGPADPAEGFLALVGADDGVVVVTMPPVSG